MGKQPVSQEVLVCEGKSLEISCEGRQQIRIDEAEYGRTASGSQYCPFILLDWNTNCPSKTNTLDITKKECDGFSSCILYANNEEYGNPCPFKLIHKYLKVC